MSQALKIGVDLLGKSDAVCDRLSTQNASSATGSRRQAIANRAAVGGDDGELRVDEVEPTPWQALSPRKPRRGGRRQQENLTLEQSKQPSAWSKPPAPKRTRRLTERSVNAPDEPGTRDFLEAMFYFRETGKSKVTQEDAAKPPMGTPGMPPPGMLQPGMARVPPPGMPPRGMPPPGMPPKTERLPPPRLGSVASQIRKSPRKVRRPHVGLDAPQRRQKDIGSKDNALWSRRVEMQW